MINLTKAKLIAEVFTQKSFRHANAQIDFQNCVNIRWCLNSSDVHMPRLYCTHELSTGFAVKVTDIDFKSSTIAYSFKSRISPQE